MFFEPSVAKSGFTLAELLVMLLIVATLFSMALPAVIRLTGRSKLDSAANEVHAALKLARQHAVAHKQPTYLVLDPVRRAFALYTIDVRAQPISTSDGQFIQDWSTLPEGVVFDPDIDRGNNVFDPARGPWQGALTRNNALLVEGEKRATFGFKPNGTAASATRQIYLAEGIVADEAILPHPTAAGKRIRTTTLGKSLIQDYLPQPAGSVNLMGEKQ